LKFQAVAEKTAKDARGLLYFAAPGIWQTRLLSADVRQLLCYSLVVAAALTKRQRQDKLIIRLIYTVVSAAWLFISSHNLQSQAVRPDHTH